MVDFLTDIPEDSQEPEPTAPGSRFLYWVKRIGYRIWRLSAEFGAVLMGVSIVWLYALSSLLTQQTVDISGAKSNIGLLFADAVAGAGVEIPSMKLDWYPATDDIVFTGSDIIINANDGTEMQSLTELRSFFPLSDVSKGRMIPRKLVLEGGVVSWIEDETGRIRAGLGTPETLGRLGPLWQGRRSTAQREARFDLEGVEAVQIRDATAYYINATNGVVLTLNNIALDFSRDSDVLITGLKGNLAQDALINDTLKDVPVALDIITDSQFKTFDVAFEARGINPHAEGPKRGRYKDISRLDASVDVKGAFLFGRESGLQSANVDLNVSDGLVDIPNVEALYGIESFSVNASLNSGDAEMKIQSLNLASEKLNFAGKGKISDLGAINDGDVNSSPLFDLKFASVLLDVTPILAAPLSFEAFDVTGRLDIDAQTLAIEDLKVDRGTHSIQASFFADRSETGSFEKITADGVLSGIMSPTELLDIWPVKFADGARRWIERSVIQGEVDSLSFDAEFGLNEEDIFVEKKMDLDWTVRNSAVRYISTMTPLTEASGKAKITNNALVFELDRGRIGNLNILPSRVDIPRLRPKGGDLIVTMNAQGQASEMLSLINQEPFKFADRYDVNPNDIAGQGQVALTITRPLLEFFDRNRINYSATGNLTGVSAPFRVGPHQLKNGDVSLDVDKVGLRVDGPVNIGPWRTNLEWRETFDNGLTPTRYRVFGPMEHSILDDLGLGLREFFDGVIDVDINATGAGVNVQSATLQADLTNTEITFGEIWSKSLGEAGQVKASLTRGEQGTNFQSIDISAPELEVQGALSLTPKYALRELSLDKLKISNFVEGALKLRPDNDREMLSASLTGQRLDISTFLDQSFSSQTSAVDVPILLSAQLDTLVLDPLYETQNASLLYSHDGVAMTSLRLSADTEDGPMSVNLQTDVPNKTRVMNVNLPNAAKATRAFLGLESMEGGKLTLTGNLPLPGDEGPYVGRAIIEDFTLKEAPIMAQLLSLGSLTGLFDTLSGEGLGFDRFESPFQLLGGVLTIRDGSVYGPALGMTGQGNIDLNDKTVDIDGALVPAYTANSLLGDIPVLGSLLVGKKGEGIFALSYTVEGPFEATQIAVNPLSALTPGFLRGIFRKQREDMPDMEAQKRAEELLEEAEKVAPPPQD